MFKAGSVHQAWDKSPRFKGKQVGLIRVTRAPYLEKLKDMPDNHFWREGGTLHWADKAAFIEALGGPEEEYWVLEFEFIACTLAAAPVKKVSPQMELFK